MSTEICLVAPYEKLSEVARSVSLARGYRFDIETANLEDAVALLPRLEGRGYQVLISRGKTAQLLRRHTTLPVVDIKTSSFDALRVMTDLSALAGRIAIVGHDTVMRNCKTVADMLGLDSYCILFDQEDSLEYEDLRRQVRDRFARDPVEVMIGDTISQSHFGNLCKEFRFISSGPESVQEAVESAQAFLKVLQWERGTRNHLSTVLDMFEKAVFSLDRAGRITHANRTAASIFQLSRAEMLGKPIETVDPSLAIARETIANGIWEVGQVVETRQGRMVCYLYPIESDGTCHSIVFALEKVERLFTIEQKVRYQEQQKSKFKARYRIDDYVTCDPAMRTRLNLLHDYARTDATILITGESGTGKELLAQGIHNASSRAMGPFVAVNCGALPPTLLESELFGYVDGAFTGASRRGKKGLFELAHRGTLFLDEIGELAKSLQTRLLRVIQERQLMRLGSEEVIPVDIRILAATNQNLEDMVAEGTFRQDLFYRLNVLQFETLPLRRRPQDILPCARMLLRKHAQTYQRNVIDLDADLCRLLQGYSWPGNFRQLGNIMERIAITAKPPMACLSVVEPALGDLRNAPLMASDGGGDRELLAGDMESIRRRIVLRVLAEENGNKVVTARRLGVDRGTLNRWLRNPDQPSLALSAE